MATWLSSLTGVPSAREQEWVAEEAEAASLLRDVGVDLDDREAKAKRGADATRLTASIRRKMNTLQGRLTRLEAELLPALGLCALPAR